MSWKGLQEAVSTPPPCLFVQGLFSRHFSTISNEIRSPACLLLHLSFCKVHSKQKFPPERFLAFSSLQRPAFSSSALRSLHCKRDTTGIQMTRVRILLNAASSSTDAIWARTRPQYYGVSIKRFPPSITTVMSIA